MKCLMCGEPFTPLSVNQKYCSARCGARYRRHHDVSEAWPSITFQCAKCGRLVRTEAGMDRRTRFCSPECERRYWRHPPSDSPSANQTYRSVGEYASHERRTNNE